MVVSLSLGFSRRAGAASSASRHRSIAACSDVAAREGEVYDMLHIGVRVGLGVRVHPSKAMYGHAPVHGAVSPLSIIRKEGTARSRVLGVQIM